MSAAVWWRALRPYAFTATVMPVACAFAYAHRQTDVFDAAAFVMMLACALLLHAGVNLLNDYYDLILGFDSGAAHGASGVMQEGLLGTSAVLRAGRGCVVAGAVVGLALAALRGWILLPMGVAGVAGAWFYSHPRGYKYLGLGEGLVFFLMGPLLFLGAARAAGGSFSLGTVLLSLPFGCLVTAIMLVNNLRDTGMDAAAGFRTLPACLGAVRAKALYAVLFVVAFASLAPLAIVGERGGMGFLLPLLSLPAALRQLRTVIHARDPVADLARAPEKTAGFYLLFSLLLLIGMVV